jgi:hypothetical protein
MKDAGNKTEIYKMTAWRQSEGQLFPHQVEFMGKEIQNSGDVDQLFKEGVDLLIKQLPGERPIETMDGVTL